MKAPGRQFSRRALAATIATVLVALAAPPALAAGVYVNPLAGDSYTDYRTDMGVDFCLHWVGEPIRAIGDGVVVGITPGWANGEPYIWYRLSNGPDAGRYVYVAEQIDDLAHVGQHLKAGDPVARYRDSGTCIEMGWAVADGATLAQATTGYTEGEVTPAGVSFARFLMSLGVHGQMELHPPGARAARAHGHHHRHGHRHHHSTRRSHHRG